MYVRNYVLENVKRAARNSVLETLQGPDQPLSDH